MVTALVKRRYPLHLQIAALFVALIGVLGGVLSWYNYQKSSEIILEASGELFDQFNERVEVDFLMRDDGHLDPDLLRLFLESGTYRRYAERYLDPKQVDEVRIEH